MATSPVANALSQTRAASEQSRPRPWLDPVSAELHRQAPRHGPVMLMYHAVFAPGQRARWPWGVSRASFERQLNFLLAAGYATPTVSELMAAPEQYRGPTAVITFDDGYVDNVEAAAALHRRGMKATWYVVAGSVGGAPQWPFDGRPGGRLMNVAELQGLQRCGMEVGSHALTHRRLPELDALAQLHEAARSKSELEDLLGAEVRSFAYPYGAFDDASVGAVRQAGYSSACTTAPGWMLRDGDPLRLRRLTVFERDTLGSFARKLVFASHHVSWPEIARYWARRALQRTGFRA